MKRTSKTKRVRRVKAWTVVFPELDDELVVMGWVDRYAIFTNKRTAVAFSRSLGMSSRVRPCTISLPAKGKKTKGV